MSILNNLNYDHEVILTGLNTSKKLLRQNDPNFSVVFEKLCYLIEEIHHFAEEDILFKPLLSETFFYTGGPRCGYFKDLKILQSLVARGDLFCPPHHPLSIPVSEHRYCHEMALRIKKEWSIRGASVLTYFEAYENILKEHIEKEETCLFEMLVRNINQATLNKMAQLYQPKASEVGRIQNYFKQF